MTILERLEEDRIFSIEKKESGNFMFVEGCDEYFDLTLTPDEVRQLTSELLALLN